MVRGIGLFFWRCEGIEKSDGRIGDGGMGRWGDGEMGRMGDF